MEKNDNLKVNLDLEKGIYTITMSNGESLIKQISDYTYDSKSRYKRIREIEKEVLGLRDAPEQLKKQLDVVLCDILGEIDEANGTSYRDNYFKAITMQIGTKVSEKKSDYIERIKSEKIKKMEESGILLEYDFSLKASDMSFGKKVQAFQRTLMQRYNGIRTNFDRKKDESNSPDAENVTPSISDRMSNVRSNAMERLKGLQSGMQTQLSKIELSRVKTGIQAQVSKIKLPNLREGMQSQLSGLQERLKSILKSKQDLATNVIDDIPPMPEGEELKKLLEEIQEQNEASKPGALTQGEQEPKAEVDPVPGVTTQGEQEPKAEVDPVPGVTTQGEQEPKAEVDPVPEVPIQEENAGQGSQREDLDTKKGKKQRKVKKAKTSKSSKVTAEKGTLTKAQRRRENKKLERNGKRFRSVYSGENIEAKRQKRAETAEKVKEAHDRKIAEEATKKSQIDKDPPEPPKDTDQGQLNPDVLQEPDVDTAELGNEKGVKNRVTRFTRKVKDVTDSIRNKKYVSIIKEHKRTINGVALAAVVTLGIGAGIVHYMNNNSASIEVPSTSASESVKPSDEGTKTPESTIVIGDKEVDIGDVSTPETQKPTVSEGTKPGTNTNQVNQGSAVNKGENEESNSNKSEETVNNSAEKDSRVEYLSSIKVGTTMHIESGKYFEAPDGTGNYGYFENHQNGKKEITIIGVATNEGYIAVKDGSISLYELKQQYPEAKFSYHFVNRNDDGTTTVLGWLTENSFEKDIEHEIHTADYEMEI